MPARDPQVRAISCRLAAIERHHPDRDTSGLRRELREAQAAASARRLGEGRTLEERSRLAVILLGDGAA